MDSRWKITLLVMLVIISICSFFILYLVRDNRADIDRYVAGETRSVRSVAQTINETISKNYQRRIQSLLNVEEFPAREPLLRSFVMRDREALLEKSKAHFKILHNENPYFASMAWLTLENDNFLRVQRPEWFGDNVSKMRPDIVAANLEQRQKSGYAVGLSGIQYRVVQPVFYNGEHVGVLQFGFREDYLLDAIHERLHIPVILAIPKERAAFIKESKLPTFESGAFTVQSQQLNIFHDDISKVDWNIKQQRVTLQDKTYLLVDALDLLNYKQIPEAYLFVALDISEQIAMFQKNIAVVLLFSIAMLILAFIIIYFSYGSLLGKITSLNQALKKVNLNLESRVEERTARLKESESRFRSIFNGVQDGILVVNRETKRCVDANAAMCTMLGYSLDELLDLDVKKIHPEEDLENVRHHMERMSQGRAVLSMNRQVRRKDGSVLYVDINGVIMPINGQDCLVGIFRDVTERRAAQEKLIVLSRAIEASPDVIIITDMNGNVTYTNKALHKIYGYEPEELLGTPVAALSHDKIVAGEVIFPAIQQKGRWQGEDESVRKDGTTFPILLTCSLISGPNDQPIGMLGIVRDLTEIKAAEAKENELEIKLQQAQKMEAIGTLAGGIAHDFNNLLGAILGYADMERDESEEGSIHRANLDKIILAGNRAKDLVSQILAFSRQSKSEQKPLQPKLIVKEAVKLLRSSIPTTIAIQQKIDDRCGMIQADATQFHQIVMNLCTNAYHAMEENGGTLSIGLKTTELTKSDLENEPSLKPGTYIRLTVEDTGSGIDPIIKKHIFEPYFTTKQVGKGTGMGLAVVHGIVKNHGGFIQVESVPGKGTAFSVFLPQLRVVTQEKTVAKIPVPTGNEHILFVDDEQLIADMGKQLLERLGYMVTAVSSSLKALELIKAKPDQFDLVITDQTMPVLTGSDLAKEIFNLAPKKPVILCTGYSSTISKEQALAMGIKAFVLKPVVKKDIAPLIRKVLDGEILKSDDTQTPA